MKNLSKALSQPQQTNSRISYNHDRKIDAIKTLEEAFNNNPEYRKTWTDYIELSILEHVDLPQKHLKLISNDIINLLFDHKWWEAQK